MVSNVLVFHGEWQVKSRQRNAELRFEDYCDRIIRGLVTFPCCVGHDDSDVNAVHFDGVLFDVPGLHFEVGNL